MLFKAQGQLDELYELKPELTTQQQQLVNAFNRLSQERKTENGAPFPITDRDIRSYQKHNGSCLYAPDLFMIAIHAIDSEYITQQCEEMRRKANKGR